MNIKLDKSELGYIISSVRVHINSHLENLEMAKNTVSSYGSLTPKEKEYTVKVIADLTEGLPLIKSLWEAVGDSPSQKEAIEEIEFNQNLLSKFAKDFARIEVEDGSKFNG